MAIARLETLRCVQAEDPDGVDETFMAVFGVAGTGLMSK